MKHVGRIAVILAASIAAITLASAQGSGTEPQDKGNTGWTGGSRDQPSQGDQGGQSKASETTGRNTPDSITKAVQESHDVDSAKSQPEVATGEDLKGPPKQFP